jgi:hypothetical protein
MTRAPRAAALLFLLAGEARAAAGAPPAEGAVYTFEKLNRSYSDLVGTLEPIEADPVTVQLASPSHVLNLRSHSVRLSPRADGAFDGVVEAEVLGKGELIADVDLAGVRRRLADQVVLPTQTVTVTGRVRLAREAGGYRGVVDQLPAELRVAIQSNLINDILDLCDGATLLSFGAVDCSPLTRALSRPALALPQSAEIFLSDAELTEEDRAELDALLAAAAATGAPRP